MKYPKDERILVVRPCLKMICLGNKPASKLLSLLLYYARHCGEDEAEFVFMSTQEALVDDLLDEMDVKTLHRTAIPMLRLLGYLDVDGGSYRYQYTVHLDLIGHLLANYKDKQLVGECVALSIKEQLDKLPIEQKDTFPIVYDRRQLDKCLKEIDKCPIQLDKLPIQLEECLIPIRQMSNSKRGRKPRFEAVWSDEFPKPQMDRDITERYEITREGMDVSAFAPTPPAQSPSQDEETFDEDDAPTVRRLPAISIETPSHIATSGYGQGEDYDNDTDMAPHRPGSPGHSDATAHRDDTARLNPLGMAATPKGEEIEHTTPVKSVAAPSCVRSLCCDTSVGTAPHQAGGPRASGKRNGKARDEPVPIPIEALSILDDWDSLFKSPVARTEKHIQAALDLMPCHPSKDDLKACKGWLFTTDNPARPWYRKIGVKLRDVADNFGAWQSVQPVQEAEPEPYTFAWFQKMQPENCFGPLQA